MEYEKWITMQRGNAWARHCVEVAQVNAGNPSGVLEDVQTILCGNPRDSQAFFIRGCAYSSIGNITQAIEALENCLKFNTHHPLDLILLTYLHQT
jgi:hypothetical protein